VFLAVELPAADPAPNGEPKSAEGAKAVESWAVESLVTESLVTEY